MNKKNPYAAKLLEFSEIAFGEEKVFSKRGHWRELLGDRITLEVGCSNAEFLSNIATKNPDTGFVGIDWKYKVLYRGAKKIHTLNLKNAILLRTMAQEISKIFSDQEIDETWIFYPDPWPRAMYVKHRIVAEPFLSQLHKCLKPGGRVCIKTDHPGYYEWMLALFGEKLSAFKIEYDPEVLQEGLVGMSARQAKVRKPSQIGLLPPKSELLKKMFRISLRSIDFWNDADVLAATAERAFSGQVTLFEKGFLAQKLPIYYLELVKI